MSETTSENVTYFCKTASNAGPELKFCVCNGKTFFYLKKD